MNITFEERQLMSLYNTGTRTGLIAALEEMRGYLAADETELPGADGQRHRKAAQDERRGI